VLTAVCAANCSSSSQSSKTTGADSDSAAVHTTTANTGTFVINPQFDLAYQFSDGLARVRIGADKTGKWGYISR
jgi:hypothetical protein